MSPRNPIEVLQEQVFAAYPIGHEFTILGTPFVVTSHTRYCKGAFHPRGISIPDTLPALNCLSRRAGGLDPLEFEYQDFQYLLTRIKADSVTRALVLAAPASWPAKRHPMTPLDWMLAGDTGISSKTICWVMTNSKASRGWWDCDTPHDPSDFGRCHRLLLHFPHWRQRLPEVAAVFPKWGPMVAAWDQLTGLYTQISTPDGHYTKESSRGNDRVAMAMFHLMQELNAQGEIAEVAAQGTGN